MKAFPRQITFNNGITKGAWIDDGMELRDYFAAKALTAIALNQGSIGTEDYTFYEVALDAYLIADAMIEARSK